MYLVIFSKLLSQLDIYPSFAFKQFVTKIISKNYILEMEWKYDIE